MPGRTEVLSLYRGLLRHAGGMRDYNFRAHALRRVKGGFRDGRQLAPSEAALVFERGLGDLAVVKRQAAISALFPDETRSVMQQGVRDS